jgi:hypothetical protein
VIDMTEWQISDEEGGRLAARWWQWAQSAPEDRSPVADTTGEYAGWQQPDDVWFLAGTYGGRVVRRCEIPAGRPLFLPVLNRVHTKAHSRTPLGLEIARARAYLNGGPIPFRRFTTQPFRMGDRMYLSWGIWAAVTPLLPGQYVLEIDAASTGGFHVDTTYHLTAVQA